MNIWMKVILADTGDTIHSRIMVADDPGWRERISEAIAEWLPYDASVLASAAITIEPDSQGPNGRRRVVLTEQALRELAAYVRQLESHSGPRPERLSDQALSAPSEDTRG